MIHFIESFKMTTIGIIVLGAIGSIIGVVTLKIFTYILKTALPAVNRDCLALEAFYKKTINTNNRSDTIYLLILACTVLISSLIIISVFLLEIFITKYVLNIHYGNGLVIRYSFVFFLAYWTFKLIYRISDLTKAVCSKHGIKFDDTTEDTNNRVDRIVNS